MKDEIIPSGYTIVETDTSLEFHIFSRRENLFERPKLLVSVIIADTMELSAFVQSAYVPSATFEHLMSSKFLKTTSELLNVLALCKQLSDGLFNDNESMTANITLIWLLQYWNATTPLAVSYQI